eukprot:154304-Chlamydomonas_euryale.AAC.1
MEEVVDLWGRGAGRGAPARARARVHERLSDAVSLLPDGHTERHCVLPCTAHPREGAETRARPGFGRWGFGQGKALAVTAGGNPSRAPSRS